MLPGLYRFLGWVEFDGSSIRFLWWGDVFWQWYAMAVCHVVQDTTGQHNVAHLLRCVQQHHPQPVQTAPVPLQ